MLSNQAYVLAFADAFVIVAAVLGVSALLMLMLPPLHTTVTRADAAMATAPPVIRTATPAGNER